LDGEAVADQPMLASLPEPTEDERRMAFLAHVLQVFAGFIAPLVIFCIKQNSRFVKFHALQSLIWQLCYMALFFVGFFLFFFSMAATIFHSASAPHPGSGPPPAFLLFFPLFWLFAMFGWVANVILGVLYGIKANQGEWAAYPIVGKWCLAKLSPVAPSPAQPARP
jgi:uncharacterized membrane protein